MFTFSDVVPSTQPIPPSTPATSPVQSISLPTRTPSSGKSAPQPVAPSEANPGSPASRLPPQLLVSEKSSNQPPSLQAHSPVTVQSTGTSEVSQGIPTSAPIPLVPTAPIPPVPSAPSQLVDNLSQTATNLSQVAVNSTQPIVGPPHHPVNLTQPLAPPQVACEPSRSIPKPPKIPAEATATRPASGPTSIPPQLITNAVHVTTTPPTSGARYRARVQETTASSTSSRRGSIDGAPAIADFEIPSHHDSTNDDTPEVIVDLSEYLNITSDIEEGSHVSSSQKSSDGCQDLLSLPPSSQWRHSGSGREEETPSRSQSPPAQNNPLLDAEDLPSWMTKKGQWKYVASTAGGPHWKKLLEVYLEQERTLEFRDMVSSSHVPSVSLFLIVHRVQLLRTRAGQ